MIVKADDIRPGDVVLGRADMPRWPSPLTVRSVQDHRAGEQRLGPRVYWKERVRPVDLRSRTRMVVQRAS